MLYLQWAMLASNRTFIENQAVVAAAQHVVACSHAIAAFFRTRPQRLPAVDRMRRAVRRSSRQSGVRKRAAPQCEAWLFTKRWHALFGAERRCCLCRGYAQFKWAQLQQAGGTWRRPADVRRAHKCRCLLCWRAPTCAPSVVCDDTATRSTSTLGRVRGASGPRARARERGLAFTKRWHALCRGPVLF